MPCKDFEKRIYLYSELSSEERRTLEEHLQQCDSCRALLNDVQSMTKKVQEFAAVKPVPRNNANLTHQIMSGVEKSKNKNSVLSSLNTFFAMPTLRYSLAALSIIIVASFITEQGIGEQQTYSGNENLVSKTSSVLNTNHFLKTLETNRQRNVSEKRFSILQCLSSSTCDQLSFFKTKQNHEQPH